MKIAFPTQEDQGLESQVYGHFGSAGGFIIVDTESEEFETVSNTNKEHAHGQCQPLAALGGKSVNAVAVGGIGGGALMKLNAAGVTVFRAAEGTIKFNLELIGKGQLPTLTMDQTCAGHGHQGGCAH